MGALNVGAILRAEHEVLESANEKWLGMGDNNEEDIGWVTGVISFASHLIKILENNDADKNE